MTISDEWVPMAWDTSDLVPFEPHTVAFHCVKQSREITILEIRRLQCIGPGSSDRHRLSNEELTPAELRGLACGVLRRYWQTIGRQLAARLRALLRLEDQDRD